MPLKTFLLPDNIEIVAEELTPESFKHYGGVLSADHQIKNANNSEANYGTAKKLHKVSPIVNNFDNCKSGKKATANWNIFRCSSPNHIIQDLGDKKIYTSTVLERHPYSTQTFIPMGQDLKKDSYIVIVAKTDENSTEKLPDPSQVKAFVCKGNQAVTYGAGTWHAPMVVIDQTIPYIDFAVLIHENDVAEEDCQECYFKPGYKISYKSNLRSKL